MRNFFLVWAVSLLFIGCSSSKTPYAWQGEAKAYLSKYQEMMLKGDFFQAKYYLEDAVKEAKNDASLETLAIVYLSECAMQKAMFLKTSCQSYKALQDLIIRPQYEMYQKMIEGDKVDDVSALGQYRSLYEAIENKEIRLSDIRSLPTLYAQAIGSMVLFEKGLMSREISNYMIDRASQENMKGLMLVWLKKSQLFETGKRLERLKNQIKVLSD